MVQIEEWVSLLQFKCSDNLFWIWHTGTRVLYFLVAKKKRNTKKITTRLHKVGSVWTLYFTILWFCLRWPVGTQGVQNPSWPFFRHFGTSLIIDSIFFCHQFNFFLNPTFFFDQFFQHFRNYGTTLIFFIFD